jgi:hydrogenase maturation protease
VKRILVAGIGNIFHGDDAFGVMVAQRMAQGPLPGQVTVTDFGIRGVDLAYALLDGYELAILIDTTRRDGAPGTLYVLEPDTDHWNGKKPAVEGHGMVPDQALQFARSLGGQMPSLRLIACEPATFEFSEEGTIDLSEPVQAAIEPAIELVLSLIAEVLDHAEAETAGQSHA